MNSNPKSFVVKMFMPNGANDPVGRRDHVAYPVHVAVDCRFRQRGTSSAAPIQCAGQVQELSSGSCCLNLLEPASIGLGMTAELRVGWPVKLQGDVTLQLHIWGRVLRVDGLRIVVAIRRHRFDVIRRDFLPLNRRFFSN